MAWPFLLLLNNQRRPDLFIVEGSCVSLGCFLAVSLLWIFSPGCLDDAVDISGRPNDRRDSRPVSGLDAHVPFSRPLLAGAGVYLVFSWQPPASTGTPPLGWST